MREIKFRAWGDRGEKIEKWAWLDDYNHFNGEADTNNNYGNIISVEQYTGLKDKNGIEIYEGDYLSGKGGNADLWEVVFWEHTCGFRAINRTHNRWDWEYSKELRFRFTKLEVIGNIHENADLL